MLGNILRSTPLLPLCLAVGACASDNLEVLSFTPPDGAQDVSVDEDIAVDFSETPGFSSVFRIEAFGNLVNGDAFRQTMNEEETSFFAEPISGWEPNTEYYVTVPGDAESEEDVLLEWSFRTGPSDPIGEPDEECGNGVIETGEECDDGNRENDDACSNACEEPTCDDGIANGNEADVDCGGSCESPCTDWSVSNVTLAGTAEALTILPRATIPVALDYAVSTPGCSDCKTQLLAYFDNERNPSVTCAYDGTPGDGRASGSFSFTVSSMGLQGAQNVYIRQTFLDDCNVLPSSLMEEDGWESIATFTPAPTDVPYRITHEASGYDVFFDIFAPGNPSHRPGMSLFSSGEDYSREFGMRLINPSYGAYTIQGWTDNCWDVLSFNGIADTEIQQRTCDTNDTEQQFGLDLVGAGLYQMRNVAYGCVSINGSGVVGSDILRQPCLAPGSADISRQIFRIEPF